MKRTMIELIVSDNRNLDNSETEHDRLTGNYKVTINPHANAKPIELAAHELGHVLASFFQTPENLADPRTNTDSVTRFRMQLGLFGPDDIAGMVASEQQAWDFAKLMTDVSPETEKVAMDTYRNGGE
jgi:hypothetical protein